MMQFATPDRRWNALASCNPQADGAFFYAVKTTGIYCRPSCKSRLPRSENVLFFATVNEAETAGFRPCKRCQPHTESPQAEQERLITNICKTIEVEGLLPLKELAQIAGLSLYHFQRVFKQIVGVSPKEYATAQRRRRIRDRLSQNQSITATIFESGYDSSSSFYTEAENILGMTAKEYKNGAKSKEIRFAVEDINKNTNLGWVLVAATQKGICAIAFGDTSEELIDRIHIQFPQAKFCNNDPIFQQWVTAAIATIEVPQRSLNLPLDIQGTAFQQQVWQALRTIPIGSTLSYREVATQIGNPKAVRAVASACAANKLAIVIPCHRVIGSNGDLSGYRWGIERKRTLLEKEAITFDL